MPPPPTPPPPSGATARRRTRAVLEQLARPVAPRFAGRVVLVSGGGSGIGAAVALRVSTEGGAVAIADKRVDGARSVAQQITAAGGEAMALACDVAAEEEVKRAVGATVRRFGGIDAVFSSAGTAPPTGWLHEMAAADFEAVLRINLVGTFLVAKHALPHMMQRGRGSFVSTGTPAFGLGLGAMRD